MCKLCNTDRPPYAPVKKVVDKHRLRFLEACEDYFGESVCKKCFYEYRLNEAWSDPIDHYIIDKLIRFRSSIAERRRARGKAYNDLIAEKTTYSRIEKNIMRHEYPSGLVSYCVRVMVDGESTNGNLKTIEEARVQRDIWLDERRKLKEK